MSGRRSFSCLVLRCAAWLAGAERAIWIAAMEAETDAVEESRTIWALGCLWAVLADRVTRDRWFLLNLFALPALAFCLVVPLGLLASIGANMLGIPIPALVPVMLFGPLPCAWLLGSIRPSFSATLVGTIGFLVHQSVPLLAMWIVFDVTPVSFFWGPNLTYYNMPPVAGLLMSWLIWVAGTWSGTRSGRLRAASNAPASER